MSEDVSGADLPVSKRHRFSVCLVDRNIVPGTSFKLNIKLVDKA